MSVGSKATRLACINIDIERESRPDITADALMLPLRSNIFDLVFFTDVIEHLPAGSEIQSLIEIQRVMRKGGKMILTTPNDIVIYRLLDPAIYIGRHRHYSIKTIDQMLSRTGFKCLSIFSSASFSVALGVLIQDLIIFPFRKLFDVNLTVPGFIETKITDDYEKIVPDGKGYEIFALSSKI